MTTKSSTHNSSSIQMSLLTLFPMQAHSPTAPLRQPTHRSPRQKSPSPSFTDRWRDRLRSDLVARVKSARERSTANARGGDEEVLTAHFYETSLTADYADYF